MGGEIGQLGLRVFLSPGFHENGKTKQIDKVGWWLVVRFFLSSRGQSVEVHPKNKQPTKGSLAAELHMMTLAWKYSTAS